jgi:hypothetical protein
MGKPKKGQIAWNRQKVDKLAVELKEWYIANKDVTLIEEFSTMKEIPYRYFEEVFPLTSNLFKETMDLCLDIKKVRYWNQIKNGDIPQTFGIFGAKNELDYRDRVASDDKKSNKKEQPTKQGVKSAIQEAKDKFFSKPD